jgi:hypothetical protein
MKANFTFIRMIFNFYPNMFSCFWHRQPPVGANCWQAAVKKPLCERISNLSATFQSFCSGTSMTEIREGLWQRVWLGEIQGHEDVWTHKHIERIESSRTLAISAPVPFHRDCGSPCINHEYVRETLKTNFYKQNYEKMHPSQFPMFMRYSFDGKWRRRHNDLWLDISGWKFGV